jgi:CheY-like chemotaxis protein/HPt (histidine-containing phosphotransfer) domain-containing protein
LDNQALISAKLRETGLDVEIAPNGQIAVEKAMAVYDTATPFDLVLMDVSMPVMDGFTATQKLRAKGFRTPIIALTANAMERDRNKCLNAGCNDFVTKPIAMEKLFKAISKYMTIEQVKQAPAPGTVKDETSTEGSTSQAQKFYQELPEELADMQQAIERQDRERLKEVAQLILGKAAAAGLKQVAPEAAKLLHAAESEQSWEAMKEVVAAFERACPSQDASRQAA